MIFKNLFKQIKKYLNDRESVKRDLQYFGVLSDAFLRTLESLVILIWIFLSVFIVAQTIVESSWCSQSLTVALGNLSKNWEMPVLLIFPFIYRPLRRLIERIKSYKGADMEDDEEEPEEIRNGSKNKNMGTPRSLGKKKRV